MSEDSVDDVLGADHERVSVLLRALRDAPESAAFRSLDAALRRHIRWEEEVLFPAVRPRATEAEKRSIDSLRIDHERIGETLDRIASALGSGGLADARQGLERLDIYLRGHNYDEEHGVYVEADRYLSAAERRALLARLA